VDAFALPGTNFRVGIDTLLKDLPLDPSTEGY